MIELNTIENVTTWNDASEKLNDNFRKINIALENGSGGGGGGSSEESIISSGSGESSIMLKDSDSIVNGDFSTSLGKNNEITGDYSTALGYGNIVSNEAEHTVGKHNISTVDSTIYSIGIGTSATDRKNALEVDKDGKIYGYGIGGYDGTNASDSNDLKTVIDEKQNKSSLSTVATTGSYNDLTDKPTIPDTSTFLPISGGTLTGQLNTKAIVPTGDKTVSIGTSSLKYNTVYAKRLQAQEILGATASGQYSVAIGTGATAKGNCSFAIGDYAICGVTTDDESLPYIKYAAITPNKVVYEGVEYNGIYVPKGSTITYQYDGVEYSYTNTSTSMGHLLAIISDNSSYDLKLNSYAFPILNQYGPVISEPRILSVTELKEGVKAVGIKGYDRNNTQSLLSSQITIYVRTKVSSSTYNGDYATSLGYACTSSAQEAVAIGSRCYTYSNRGFAMGYQCIATGNNSFAMGGSCVSLGGYAIAAGRGTYVSGSNAVAFGVYNFVGHNSTVAIGTSLVSGRTSQVVVGSYNEGKSGTAFELGWGNSNNTRKNIFEVGTNGNATSSGTMTATKHITVGGTSAQFVKGDGTLDKNEYALKSEMVAMVAISDTNDYDDVF